MRRRIATLMRQRACAHSGAAFQALWHLARIIEQDTVAFRTRRLDPYAHAKSLRDRGPNKRTRTTLNINELFKAD